MNDQTAENKEVTEVAEVTELKRLVGVQFSRAGKVHSFDAGTEELVIHDLVMVEGEKGPIIGKVIVPVFEKNTKEVPTNIKKVLRKASAEDIEKSQRNKEEAMNAFHLCQKKIVEHGLEMKLVDVDILTGDNKAIFYFTAEERVDFRSLVKDLATALHMRIEMRQIGARDAAKGIGCIGSCGLTCCCETHLREFRSVAIQMAKNQGLSPNPAKLTGMCGKLKCCLVYENEMYSELKKPLPDVGSEVETTKGIGIVNSLDIPRQFIYVRFVGEPKDVRFKPEDIKSEKKRAGRKRAKKEKKESN